MEKAYRDSEAGVAVTTEVQPILMWKVHLLRDEPGKLFLIAPVVVVGLLCSYLMFRNLMFSAVTLLLFSFSLAEYLFPIRYQLTEKGAEARTRFGRTFIEWERVRKYYIDDRGLKLSPLGRLSRLEAFRGVYLRFGDHREEIVEVVRRMRDVVRANTGDERAAQPGGTG